MVDLFLGVTITEYIVIDEREDKSDKPDSLNVAYGVDNNYLFGVGVSITSIIINNNRDVIFHIVADKYDAYYIRKIKQLAVDYKVKISLYTINSKRLRALPCTKVWSHAMYFRLFVFSSFSRKIERLLYLDADVICKGSLSEIASLNLDGYAAAVIPDIEPMQERAVVRLNDPSIMGRYFNSGVVYANLAIWQEERLTEKALDLLMHHDDNVVTFKYPDQDILNVILMDRTIFLPRKFNTIYTIKSELEDKTHSLYKEIITDETVLIHYTGATKPWHEWAVYPSVIYFNNSLERSPWRNQARCKARTIIEFKKRYKHLLVQKRYIKGIISGVVYGFKKYIFREL